MTEYVADFPTELSDEYGCAVEAAIRVYCEVTPADTAPRDRFDQAEYPSTPETIEVFRAFLMVGGVLVKEVTAIVADAMHAKVVERIAAERKEAAESAASEAYYDAHWAMRGNE